MKLPPTNKESPQTQNIRDRIDVVTPRFLRFGMTEITGKATTGETALWLKNSYQSVFIAFSSLIGGVLLSNWAMNNSNLVSRVTLLLLGWLVTIFGARTLQVGVSHSCAHINCFKHQKIDFVLGEMISIMIVIRAFVAYAPDHLNHHNLKKHLTLDDETIRFLFSWVGLRPGKSKSWNKRKLMTNIISPTYHLKFLWGRIKGCFCSSSTFHNTLAIIFWSSVLVFITTSNLWLTFFVSWFFPITILYQISTTLRLTLEHLWPDNLLMQHRDTLFVCNATANIYCGEMPPNKTGDAWKDVMALSQWYLRMVFVHLVFERLFILVADTPNHAVHHRFPKSDWNNAPYIHQMNLERGSLHYPEPYIEIWGAMRAIDMSLESLAKQPHLEVSGSVY